MNKTFYFFLLLLAWPVALFAQTNLTDSLLHQNLQRQFMVHLPPGFSSSQQRALVVNLHGGSGNMVSAQGFSQMNPVADQNNFVVAWPQGIGVAAPGFSWADGRNTSADQAGIDDIGFIHRWWIPWCGATTSIRTAFTCVAFQMGDLWCSDWLASHRENLRPWPA